MACERRREAGYDAGGRDFGYVAACVGIYIGSKGSRGAGGILQL